LKERQQNSEKMKYESWEKNEALLPEKKGTEPRKLANHPQVEPCPLEFPFLKRLRPKLWRGQHAETHRRV